MSVNQGISSDSIYDDGFEYTDAIPLVGKSNRRGRATAPAVGRDLFDYVHLGVQVGIFFALVYLGAVLTETKNQVNSFKENQNVMVDAITSGIQQGLSDGLVSSLVTAPTAIIGMLLNSTTPLFEDVMTFDLGGFAVKALPTIKQARVAVNATQCMEWMMFDGDDDAMQGDCNSANYRTFFEDDGIGISAFFSDAEGILANVKEMPAPSGGNVPPQSAALSSIERLFSSLNNDISTDTWMKLHPKCIEFVSRFKAIKWDQSYQGECVEVDDDHQPNPGNTSWQCSCDLALNDDDFTRQSTNCRPHTDADCKCFLHSWKTELFRPSIMDNAHLVCDGLAGMVAKNIESMEPMFGPV